ncbi:MAG: excinuclease ABC subunit UvrC [Actinomycetaceae bacterium]|nr:excinuclease ABC subunit UvrC [Actinomycetaceae bacterium]
MADPQSYRPKTSEIPIDPGVYRFIDERGRVIYVGKAKNLRNRLTSYFQDLSALHPRTFQMVTSAASVQWTVVNSEVEALTLEYSWIKEYKPRFNVMFKDDKSYPYFAVTMDEQFPRMMITRQAKRRGVRYFGPYSHVWAIRETLDQLIPAFPVRTCSMGVFRRAQAQGRPCLLGYIDRCSAPCTGRISQEDHYALAQDVCDFMSGKAGPFIRNLEDTMRRASDEMRYEDAARTRDALKALTKVLERNLMVLGDGTDADVYAIAVDELDASIQVFYIRGGRIRGQRGWVTQRTDDSDEAGLMGRLLEQNYAEVPESRVTPQEIARAAHAVSVDDIPHTPTSAIPKEILLPVLPEDVTSLEAWLGEKRGAKVRIRVPQRGEKRALLETVETNATQALALHKTRRSSDLEQRSLALGELAELLDLPQAPLRIECFDVSHTQGTHQVASMVVFEDGMPKKSAYRHFTIQGEGVTDDTAAMSEVLVRRFRRLLEEELAVFAKVDAEFGEDDTAIFDEDGQAIASGPIDAETGKPRRFSYRPDLVVVDGGLPQVNAAKVALDEVGVDIPIVGLAKRLEEVWLPDSDYPLIFSRTSPALYLLQYLRDESHRFAITAHRKKRRKAMTRSVLDAIPGLGPARQRALLGHFGSVQKIRQASVEDISQVAGIGQGLAVVIAEKLAPSPASLEGNGAES